MNNTKLYFILTGIFAGIAVSFGETVVQSGNWSDSSTWGGSVPASSSDSPVNALEFGSDNLTLGVDGNQYINYIDTGSNTNTTINIDSGKTLYLLSTTVGGTNTVGTSSSKDNVLHFTGEGTLNLGGAGKNEGFFIKGTYIFDTAVNYSNNVGFKDTSSMSGSATYNRDVNVSGQISTGGGWDITVSEGVNMVLTASFNLWGNKSSLYLKEGASIVSKSGGAWINNGIVEGYFSSAGNQNWRSSRYAMKIGSTTFTSTSSLERASSSTYHTFIVGDMVSYAGAGKLNIGTKLYLSDGSSMTLNSSDALRIAGASSQGESDIYIAQQKFNIDGSTYTEYFSASNASLIFGADNDIGNIYLEDSSTLNITANGHKVNIAAFKPNSDGANFSINIYNLTDFTLKIGSLDNIATEVDEDGFLRTTDSFMVAVDEYFLDYAYLVAAEDGGYWVNVTSAVPEPAECALIFGALACAFAFVKRRAKNRLF